MEIDGEINGEAVGQCLSSFVDDGSTESHRYYLARRTTLEMLKDRGYAVPYSEIQLSLSDFRNIYGPTPDPDRLRISTALTSDDSKKICLLSLFQFSNQFLLPRILVIFCGPQLVKVNTIRGIAAQITNKDTLSSLILILQSKITNQAQKAVDLFSFKVEIFQITDLLLNVTKHALKPKHQVLTPAEKQKLLEKHNLQEHQLPRMSLKDAIVRYYGLQKGQVLKVMYSGEMTQSHVTYRCVS